MSDLQERLTQALSDRYAVRGELGRGGMAVVFLAHDVRHDRDVAIKVLSPELAASLGHQRFVREVNDHIATAEAQGLTDLELALIAVNAFRRGFAPHNVLAPLVAAAERAWEAWLERPTG